MHLYGFSGSGRYRSENFNDLFSHIIKRRVQFPQSGTQTGEVICEQAGTVCDGADLLKNCRPRKFSDTPRPASAAGFLDCRIFIRRYPKCDDSGALFKHGHNRSDIT